MRVALVQMPFFTLDVPSIALSLLQATLQAAGHACDIKYFNLDFGERIGVDVYSWIAASVPNQLLLGDLVFAPCIHDSGLDPARLRELGTPRGTRAAQALPEALIESFPELVAAAKAFVAEKAS